MQRASIFLGLVLAISVHAADFHVAPGGQDGNPGTPERPFASLEKARDAARLFRAGHPGEAVEVILHAGTYYRSQTLLLGAQDSGTEAAPITWRGDGEVVFSGGIQVPATALRPVTDEVTLSRLPTSRDAALKLYEIRLSDLGMKEFPKLEPRGMPTPYQTAWPELFVDAKPLPLSSWPNGIGYAGGFKPTKIISSGTSAKVIAGGASASGGSTDQPMIFSFADPRTERWRQAMHRFTAEVWMGGHWFWDWADDLLPVGAIDDKGAVTMGRRHGYGLGQHLNLHVYNLAEEMDVAGEYALEPAQQRFLVLLTEAQVRSGVTVSWLGMPLFQLDRCSHLRLHGLGFTLTRADALVASAVSELVISHCRFDKLGRHGIGASGEQIVIEDCRFSLIGASGVTINGGERKTLRAAHNRISHCDFAGFSRLKRTYAPGVDIKGVGTTVENCLFQEAPHTAILFSGNEHLIRNNEIHHVLTETGDCGAIYGGRDWTACGTRITGNWIHDLGGVSGRWPCGIYLDDCLSGIRVDNNFVEHVSLGILVGGGRYNRVEGNIFSHCDEGMHLDSRGITWMANKLDVLRQRLAEMPVNQEPWLSRYPELKDTLKNEPGKPVGTIITGNAVEACPKPWRQKSPAAVAVVTPNFEQCKKLVEAKGRISIPDCSLTYTKPKVGVRP